MLAVRPVTHANVARLRAMQLQGATGAVGQGIVRMLAQLQQHFQHAAQQVQALQAQPLPVPQA